MPYYTYIAECADKTLYTGYTTDLEKREKEHNSNKKGAKYTKGRQPIKIKYSVEYETRSEAMKQEAKIKKLSRREKLELL